MTERLSYAICIVWCDSDSVSSLNTVGKVDVPSFLSCSALSMSSGDGNVSGNVTISFCKQQLHKKLWENVSKILLVAYYAELKH